MRVAIAPAVTPRAGTVYVSNFEDDTVSAMEPDGTMHTIPVGSHPTGVVVAP